MSAPDDKISSNRRRLFKALSTAPVVMTLKPGAALANASSMQCLLKESGEVTQKFHLKETAQCISTGSTEGAGCFAYLKQRYWDVSANTQLPAFNGKIIVDTDVVGTTPNLWVMNKADGADAVQLTVDYTLTGNVLTLTGTDGAPVTTEAHIGLFLAIGGPDSTTNPTMFVADSVFPRGDTASAAANDKLSGSCLHSFQQTSSPFFLNNG
jgi:hypothetical protein